MDNLARGWAIVVEHWHRHGHGFGPAIWIAIAIGVTLPIWAARRQRNQADIEDESLRPKQRPPLPKSSKL